MYKLIDEIERLRTYPTKEELELTLEVIELIKEFQTNKQLENIADKETL